MLTSLRPVAQDVSVDQSAHSLSPENMGSSKLPTPVPAMGLRNTRVSPKDKMIMNHVPAGNFIMGRESEDSGAAPAHNVFLNSFWIDQTEITNWMYAQCVRDGVCMPPSSISSSTRESYYPDFEYRNYPVTYVSWENANVYCNWRADGSRLPTEAEWEKAARGSDQRIYPWGNTITCAFANYGECVADTTPVSGYELGQSPYGVYNLAGNVWEWVADWYSPTYYQISPAVSPVGPAGGEFRVLRGGSWLNYATSVETSNRNWYDPSATSGNLGFRCANSQ